MEPQKVDISNFYIRRNAIDHNTTKYDLIKDGKDQQPVFRRGEDFDLTIGAFKRDFNEDTDRVRLIFSFGSISNVPNKTPPVVCLVRKNTGNPEDRVVWPNPLQWDAVLVRNDRTYVIIRVHIPPETFVGLWKSKILTNRVGNKNDTLEYTVPHNIYVLFNPWNSQDPVYLENEKERDEYINNEYGKVWTGTAKHPVGKHWIYGQFNKIVLPAAIRLLEKSGLDPKKRDSPIHVSRAISAVINSIDEGGLLEDKSDGNYEDGVSPHVWTGTLPILNQYLKSEASVKYGQCWVYSAATVTICRALGIPCRSVTVYVLAHDTNESLTVDKYFDVFGDKLTNGPTQYQSETCWNFHVWNDVWMRRPDLATDHSLDGWQVIDATPLERSEGIMRCGPASVTAVRKGEVGYQYDTPFVFAAVNADVVHYKEDPDSDWGFKTLSINHGHVGRRIVTKKLGFTDDLSDTDLWDITDIYKSPEGTETERLAVFNAVRGVRRTRDLYNVQQQQQNEDVLFELVDIDSVPIGSSFDVEVRFHNRSNNTRTIRVFLSASAVYYRGDLAGTIQKGQDTFKVRPGQKDTLRITVSPHVYIDKLVEHNLIQIYAVADVEETQQTWSEEDDFTFTTPRIAITVPGVAQVGEKFEVNFSFRNPLEVPLTDCYYFVGGPGRNLIKSIKL